MFDHGAACYNAPDAAPNFARQGAMLAPAWFRPVSVLREQRILKPTVPC
jgi:hypothetical protein